MIDCSSIASEVLDSLLKALISSGIILGFFCCFLLLASLLQLVTLTLRRKWYELLGEKSWILLSAPGTIVHESAHALFCLIFRHRILEMKLFSPGEDGTLGLVDHSWDAKSLYQRTGNFFIGTGPIIVGIALIVLATLLLLPEVWEEVTPPEIYTLSDMAAGILVLICRMFRALFSLELWQKWQTWLWLAITLLIGSHITLSREDLKNATVGIWLIPVVVFLFNLAVIWFYDPAELLFKYGSARIACTMAVMIFIALILIFFTFLLHLPVFQVGSPQKNSASRKKSAGRKQGQ